MTNISFLRTLFLFLFALSICKAHSADSILKSITVAPVAVLKGADITGEHTFGTGLDLGFNVNKYVSIHGTALTYETEHWQSGVIDESELYGRANFVKYANESFVLYGKGGVARDWTNDDWALGVGLGAELRLSNHVALGSDYTIRAWFNGNEKDSLARAFVAFSF